MGSGAASGAGSAAEPAATFVVQERVGVPTEPYPSMVEGHLRIADRFVDTDPFIGNGSYMDGCLTRLSTAALLNVTAGGGSTVPTFVVESRESAKGEEAGCNRRR